MKKTNYVLAAAIAALGSAGVSDAAIIGATLTGATAYTGPGFTGGLVLTGDVSSSTATWSYDTVTSLLSQTGGTLNVRYNSSPTTTVYRHSISGLVIGNGATAAASSFACTEGNFGAGAGESQCGNYEFGLNSLDESTITYGPGTTYTRTIAGDDLGNLIIEYANRSIPPGTPQSIAAYNGFSTVNFVGTTLTVSNAVCVGTSACSAGISGQPFNGGYTLTLQTASTPVPAAVWLFGSALGLMGVMRRKIGS